MIKTFWKISLPTLLITVSCNSFACDPISLDWELFHQRYDLNHNEKFDLKEFQRVTNFAPYPWPQDPRFKNSHQLETKQSALFKFLDLNKDGQLNDEELGLVHQLFKNPCEDWPSN